jgi:hypothetical protein
VPSAVIELTVLLLVTQGVQDTLHKVICPNKNFFSGYLFLIGFDEGPVVLFSIERYKIGAGSAELWQFKVTYDVSHNFIKQAFITFSFPEVLQPLRVIIQDMCNLFKYSLLEQSLKVKN